MLIMYQIIHIIKMAFQKVLVVAAICTFVKNFMGEMWEFSYIDQIIIIMKPYDQIVIKNILYEFIVGNIIKFDITIHAAIFDHLMAYEQHQNHFVDMEVVPINLYGKLDF